MPNSPIRIESSIPIRINSSMAFISLSAVLGRRRPLHPTSPFVVDCIAGFFVVTSLPGRRRSLNPHPHAQFPHQNRFVDGILILVRYARPPSAPESLAPLVVGFNVCFYPGGCRLVLPRCSTPISPSIPHRHRIGFVEFVLVRVPRCSASVGPCILRPRSSSDWMSLNLYPGGCRLFVSFGKSDGWFIIARSQKSVELVG